MPLPYAKAKYDKRWITYCNWLWIYANYSNNNIPSLITITIIAHDSHSCKNPIANIMLTIWNHNVNKLIMTSYKLGSYMPQPVILMICLLLYSNDNNVDMDGSIIINIDNIENFKITKKVFHHAHGGKPEWTQSLTIVCGCLHARHSTHSGIRKCSQNF